MKNTKWCFKNSRKLGKIEGKIYALKLMIKGFCSDDNPLLVQIEEIEELVETKNSRPKPAPEHPSTQHPSHHFGRQTGPNPYAKSATTPQRQALIGEK